MNIRVALTHEPIGACDVADVTPEGTLGARVEFSGVVRAEENCQAIQALEYEAYEAMAVHMMRDILEDLGAQHGCLTARVVHRLGRVPVGDVAIWVGVGAVHRGEAFALVTEFMDRLKRDVPIWKRPPLVAGKALGPGP